MNKDPTSTLCARATIWLKPWAEALNRTTLLLSLLFVLLYEQHDWVGKATPETKFNFISNLIDYTAWPLVAVAFILTFKEEIADRIRNITKGSVGPASVEFDKQLAKVDNQLADTAPPGATPPSSPPQSRRIARKSSNVTSAVAFANPPKKSPTSLSPYPFFVVKERLTGHKEPQKVTWDIIIRSPTNSDEIATSACTGNMETIRYSLQLACNEIATAREARGGKLPHILNEVDGDFKTLIEKMKNSDPETFSIENVHRMATTVNNVLEQIAYWS